MTADTALPGWGHERGAVVDEASRAQPVADGSAAEWRSWLASTEAVAEIRRWLTGFAEAVGAGSNVQEFVRLAASEAATNAIVHAYRHLDAATAAKAQIHVGAAAVRGAERDELWVLIADDGCGLTPREDSPGLGRGLRLIAAVTSELTIIQRGQGGTELQMRFDLADDAGATDWTRTLGVDAGRGLTANV